MIVSLIVAAAENNIIGDKGTMPWKLPNDWKHFRNLTKGHPVIMGRKTYDSLPEGSKPLPERTNIVVTRRPDLQLTDCTVVGSMQSAIYAAKDTGAKECFVIGGGEIYRRALSMADKIYLTRVHHLFEGDTTFPDLPEEDWMEAKREDCEADDRHPYAYSFLEYQRR